MKKYIVIVFIMAALLAGCTETATDTNSISNSAISSTIIEKNSSNESVTLDSENAEVTTTSKATTTTNATTSKTSIKNSSKESTSHNNYTSSNKTTSYKDFTSGYNPSKPILSSTTSIDLEAEYKTVLSDLNFEYSEQKYAIEDKYYNLMYAKVDKEDDLKYKIATLQNQCSVETTKIDRQITELQKKQIEAETLGATNSYYATLAKQYQSQINSLNSQKSSILNNYGNQIKSLQKELDKLPSYDDIINYKELALSELNKWYSEQLEKINNYYGK